MLTCSNRCRSWRQNYFMKNRSSTTLKKSFFEARESKVRLSKKSLLSNLFKICYSSYFISFTQIQLKSFLWTSTLTKSSTSSTWFITSRTRSIKTIKIIRRASSFSRYCFSIVCWSTSKQDIDLQNSSSSISFESSRKYVIWSNRHSKILQSFSLITTLH